QVVDVVGEPLLGQDLQRVHPGPYPVVVVAGGPEPGDLLDRGHAVGDPVGFGRAGELVLAGPPVPVCPGLVAPVDDHGGHVRMAADRVADHEGSDLDVVPV